MSRITPKFETYKQQDGAASAEVEQAENRSRSELRSMCGPPTRACLGVLGATPPACAQYGCLHGRSAEMPSRGALSLGTV